MLVKVSVTLAIVCVFVSFMYYKYVQEDINELETEQKVAFELKSIIGQRKTLYKRIAVGTNANVDLVLSGVALLRELNVTEHDEGSECNEVTSLEVLEQCFSYFMAKGAAAEKQIISEELNDEIIAASEKVSQTQHLVGGNAALIGLKLAELVPDGQVMLCGPVGPKLKSLLSDRVVIPRNCQVSNDEYHLILEYQENEKWGKNFAPIASRFIMSHDVANSILNSLEPFIEETSSFQPDIVVVSGFHLLDGKKESLFRERVLAASQAFSKLPKSVPVHLELASMSYCEVIQHLAVQIFPVVDSIGLNEQELVFITQCLGGPHDSAAVLEKKDQIGYYSDLIKWILDEYGKDGRRLQNSRLTRVHFHCLYTHILAVLPHHWSSNEASVSAGSWSAFSQACATDVANSSKAELRMPSEFSTSLSLENITKFNTNEPVSMFQNGDIHFYVAPVLVCKRPLMTVGLGDAISASGLLYNVFTL